MPAASSDLSVRGDHGERPGIRGTSHSANDPLIGRGGEYDLGIGIAGLGSGPVAVEYDPNRGRRKFFIGTRALSRLGWVGGMGARGCEAVEPKDAIAQKLSASFSPPIAAFPGLTTKQNRVKHVVAVDEPGRDVRKTSGGFVLPRVGL
jgi:hypothetical protein